MVFVTSGLSNLSSSYSVVFHQLHLSTGGPPEALWSILISFVLHRVVLIGIGATVTPSNVTFEKNKIFITLPLLKRKMSLGKWVSSKKF